MDPTQAISSVIVFLLMTIVGLELGVDDFRRVAQTPRAVLGGTLAQLIFLPLMTWAVVELFSLRPVFGVGALLVALSPGAGISNVFVAIARANVALSVSLTALGSVVAVFSLPALTSLASGLFLDDSILVEVPVSTLIVQLVAMLLVPISLGMGLRARRPSFAERLRVRLQRVLVLVMGVGTALAFFLMDEEQLNFDGSGTALVAAAVWALLAMLLGWATALLLGLETRDRFTFLVEFSSRNIAVSSIVALSGLGRLDLTYFSGVYFLTAYPLAAMACLLHRRFAAPRDLGEVGA